MQVLLGPKLNETHTSGDERKEGIVRAIVQR